MWRNWHGQGVAAHHLRYRFSYLLARCAYRARRDPAALALPVGYLHAALRRERRYEDAVVVGALRERQRARHAVAALRSRRSAPSPPGVVRLVGALDPSGAPQRRGT
jgi:hypothetical protein